jgi:hypothetical protein
MISRRLVAWTPVLLIAGIVAQVIALVFVILLYVPGLIWPRMFNRPYNWITEGMARMAVRTVIGSTKRREDKAPVS